MTATQLFAHLKLYPEVDSVTALPLHSPEAAVSVRELLYEDGRVRVPALTVFPRRHVLQDLRDEDGALGLALLEAEVSRIVRTCRKIKNQLTAG